MPFVQPAALQVHANADPEFRLAARYWHATLSLEAPTHALRVAIADGQITACGEAAPGQPTTITVVAPEAGWSAFLSQVPRPFYQDLLGGCGGALCTPARRDLTPLHHPRVSNEYRASLMYGITSPESPEACHRETAWLYAQGALGVFKGDLYYYTVDHDLTQQAPRIDTTQTQLYVLTGEYDWSSTPAMGQALVAALPGATFRLLPGLGHFPMSEDPKRFREYILPVLDEIRVQS
jgi:pimeloyl-ACP methyl ester carboxylesterase